MNLDLDLNLIVLNNGMTMLTLNATHVAHGTCTVVSAKAVLPTVIVDEMMGMIDMACNMIEAIGLDGFLAVAKQVGEHVALGCMADMLLAG